jgi:F-type H+-transporting ATPase subunit a
MTGTGVTILAAAKINPGEHPSWNVAGLSFHSDTIISTIVAGVIVCGLGLLMARQSTSGVPNKLQLTWEMLVEYIEGQVRDAMGRRPATFVVPLGVTLGIFILIANWLEVLPAQIPPSHEYLPSPTSDINLPAAMAVLVLVWAHIIGFKRHGIAGYVKSFLHKPRLGGILVFFRFIEEVAKFLSLPLRLFGNLFAGGLMISLIGLFPFWLLWAPTALWKLFDMFIGGIQALIFSLLTIVYFSFAVNAGEEEAH